MTSLVFGAGSDKTGSRENLLASAATYTQKMFQNPTVTRIKDQMQQVAQEMKYAVSDAPLEPDLEAIKKAQTRSPGPKSAPECSQNSNKPKISSEDYNGRFRRRCLNSLVTVEMTSVYTCVEPTCQKVMYDEDIMAQWNHDDSNFSIK